VWLQENDRLVEELDKQGTKNVQWLGNESVSFTEYDFDPPSERQRILRRELGANKSATWKIQ
jgi:hypothetical protein